jgi:hypothetical protein
MQWLTLEATLFPGTIRAADLSGLRAQRVTVRSPLAMNRRMRIALAVFAVFGATAKSQTPTEPAAQLISEARNSFGRVRDYVGTMVRQERVGGQLQPEQFIDLRVRQQPYSVYLKWTSPKQFVGQEAFYITGKNNNEMKAKGAGLAGIAGYLSMPPNDPRALRHSRHTITETGIGHMIETIARSYELERRFPPSQVKVQIADYAFQQRVCTRMEVTHLVNNGQFYCYRCVVYFDKEMKLPVRFEAYDWPKTGGDPNGELIECYSYINLKFNVGLTDAAFGN